MFRFWLSYLFYLWALVHRTIGSSNNDAPEFRRAAHYFGRAYAQDPSFKRAKLDQAIMLWRELGEAEPALALLDELAAEDPPYGPALFNRALIHQQGWDLPACAADLEAYLTSAGPEDVYWEAAVHTLHNVRQALAGGAE